MKIAVIDIGSNAIRMGIYTYDKSIVQLSKYRYSTRIVEGMEKDNILKPEPIKRSVDAMVELKKIIDENDVDVFRAIATESLRRPLNSDVFINAVYEKTGINVEVIDGKTECQYGAYAASTSAGCDDFYAFDIGGGSFELSKIINGRVAESICLPYGCVILTEKFLPDQNGTELLDDFIDEVFSKYEWLSQPLPVVVLGGSGKCIVRASMRADNENDLDKMTMLYDEICNLYKTICNTPVEKREKVFNMESNRKDIIISGIAIMLGLFRKTGSQTMILCTKSIREGVAKEILCR